MPPLLVLTDRGQARRPLTETVGAAIDGGARYVVLRERDLRRDERAALAGALRQLLAPAGGRLIVAGTDPLGGDAVHLAERDPVVAAKLVGRSCHSPSGLCLPAGEPRLSTADYCTVSPVFRTESKPGYGPPLGLDGLARLCRQTEVPVFALGGVTPDNAAACVSAGATGVAVMGAVMRAVDPAACVRELLRAVTA